MESTWFSFSSWLIYSAIAAIALGICIAVRIVRRSMAADKLADASSAKRAIKAPLVYTDAQTVRVRDAQRLDRLHRVVSLKAGAHTDLLDLTFDRIPRLRIAFTDIEQAAIDESATMQEYARIQVELGGAVAGCGSLVKEVGTNQFLIPLVTQDEHRCSILHIYGNEGAVSFLRIKVVRLDSVQHAIDADVLHVCGQWAA